MLALKNKRRKIWWVWLLAAALLLGAAPVWAVGGRTDGKVTDARELEGWPSGPSITGESAYLVEINSGTVLYGKNENETRYPASITKVMTALVVLENCALDEPVTFSHEAVTDIESGGSFGYLNLEGETYTVEQCLYLLLLESVNESGYALAEHVAGSLPAFAELMNQKAASLGCTNTHFANPHGLNDENHTTTAHDMALILWAALQNETFYRIDSATSYEIPATEQNPNGYRCTMHHKMMISDSEYYDERVKAGKTGYTSIAKNTLVTYAEQDGMELVCVVMKDAGGGVVYQDTKALLDYGFENFRLVDMSATSENFCSGLQAGYPMPLSLSGNAYLTVPVSMSSVTLEFAERTESDPEGTVGNLLYRSGDVTLGSQPVVIRGSAGDKPALETAAEPQKEGRPFWFWPLVILGALVGLVVLAWDVIQILKANRRRKRRKLRRQRREEYYRRQQAGRPGGSARTGGNARMGESARTGSSARMGESARTGGSTRPGGSRTGGSAPAKGPSRSSRRPQ